MLKFIWYRYLVTVQIEGNVTLTRVSQARVEQTYFSTLTAH